MSIAEIMSARLDFLERIDQGHWLRWPVAGIGSSWIGGVWAQIDGTHIVNLIALCILAIGGSIMGIWRSYDNKQIQAREKRRLSDIKVSEAALEEHRLSEIRIAEAERLSFARVPGSILAHPVVSGTEVVAPSPSVDHAPPAKSPETQL